MSSFTQPTKPGLDAAVPIDVLHVPYTYFPDAAGGTEIYVAGLAAALRHEGMESAVAAPAERDFAYDHDGIRVYRLAGESLPQLEHAYGRPDHRVAESFRDLIARLKPKIVHLHAHTAGVSEQLVDISHEAGAKVVFTYHSPTVSCARGTMIRLGRSPCDGRLERRRCTACVLQRHGVGPLVRDMIAHMPPAIGCQLGRAGLAGNIFTVLRMPSLIGALHHRFTELMRKADLIVAVCVWVQEALRLNGAPDEKLVLCRQGLSRPSHLPVPVEPDRRRSQGPRPLHLGFFGRVDPTKGLDILIDALRLIPHAPARLDIYGIRQPGSEAYFRRLQQIAAHDSRIAFRPALPPDAVGESMRRCDLVGVPSRWLETGPLVVLEAFDAGTPVLGARRGGIAELVSEGRDGILVSPEDPAAWAGTIAALAEAPQRVASLRGGIRPPRSMDDVAQEMSRLYRQLLGHAEG